MIIKKFQGKNEAEATEAARKELGNAVVIMNVKNVKRKGLFGFLKPQLVEVTVALEEENERYPEPSAPRLSDVAEAVADVAKLQKMTEEAEKSETKKAVEPQKAEPGNVETKKSEAKSAVQNEKELMSEAQHPKTSGLAQKLDNLQSFLEQNLQKTEEESDETITTGSEDEKPSELSVFKKLLYSTMLENEVAPEYASPLLEEIDKLEKMEKTDVPLDYVLATIYQKMILKFGKPAKIQPAENNPKVVFFVGPTGVGKTTTIAKIASKFSLVEKKRVALFTTDTYRIAAAEQLRTYANILEVPFRVIYTVEELEAAIQELHEYDYILVDTAGHSHHNEEQKENLGKFIAAVPTETEKEIYLVLSATTKYRDLITIADTYKKMTDYRLIFTKLDETTTLGNLFNLRQHTGAALSYVTYGQNVPDDISDFNPQKTVKQLLGGRKAED
ncbi:MAG: flagellar biosynthesis protein FlhF [Lachnospiraceae bacterium]|nr:flagellar biosynthesis protein FlhF [Lachnospiraceae bacterium]